MEPSPGLALRCVVVISDLVGSQEREIELEREREREILQTKKTVAALGAFLGRVRSISRGISLDTAGDFTRHPTDFTRHPIVYEHFTHKIQCFGATVASWLAAAAAGWLPYSKKSAQNFIFCLIAFYRSRGEPRDLSLPPPS